jgi:hypothetical protein
VLEESFGREKFSSLNKEGVGGILYVVGIKEIIFLNIGIFKTVCVVGRLDGF